MGSWTKYHAVAFCLTFMTLALYHMERRSLSYVKSSIVKEWTPPRTLTTSCRPINGTDDASQRWRASLFPDVGSAEEFLGVLNATFLCVYAVALYISGVLAGRLNLCYFLITGMVLSAAVQFIFGPVLEWTDNRSKTGYVTLMVMNGITQSTGWPCVVAVMGNWFGRSTKGELALTLWGTASSVGCILGALIVSMVVRNGYEYGFVLTSSITVSGAILAFVGLISSPAEAGLATTDDASTMLTVEAPRLLSHGQSPSFPELCYDDLSPEQIETDDELSHSTLRSSQVHSQYCRTGAQASDSTPLLGHPKMRSMKYTIDTATDARVQSRCNLSVDDRKDVHSKRLPAYEGVSEESWLGALVDSEDRSYTGSHNQGNRLQYSDSYRKGNRLLLFSADDSSSSPESVCDPTDGCREKEWLLASPKSEETRWKLENNDNVDSSADCDNTQERNARSNNSQMQPPKAVGFVQVLLLPGVLPYTLACGFITSVNYIFFFWLPFYLSSAHGWRESMCNQLSVWFDVGSVAGCVATGLLCARVKKRALVITPMMVLVVPVLYVYDQIPPGQPLALHATILFILGFFLAGFIKTTAAISADLGSQKVTTRTNTENGVKGYANTNPNSPQEDSTTRGRDTGNSQERNVNAVAIVAGVMEGTGAVASALAQLALPFLNTTYGWGSVFYMMMAATALCVVCMVPAVIGELKQLGWWPRRWKGAERATTVL